MAHFTDASSQKLPGQERHLKDWCPNERGWNSNPKNKWEKEWNIAVVLLKVNLWNSLLSWKLCVLFLKCVFPPLLNFKVEGDTVTFSFEMRSGREHNTPDKAMWGFACTVRAQVLESNHCGGRNVLFPMCLGYIHHICLGNRAKYELLFHPSFPSGIWQ